jgi:hypothetical protein
MGAVAKTPWPWILELRWMILLGILGEGVA